MEYYFWHITYLLRKVGINNQLEYLSSNQIIGSRTEKKEDLNPKFHIRYSVDRFDKANCILTQQELVPERKNQLQWHRNLVIENNKRKETNTIFE